MLDCSEIDDMREPIGKKEVQLDDFSQTEIKAKEDDAKADKEAEAAQRKQETKEVLELKCTLNRPTRLSQIKKYLSDYWGVENPSALEKVNFVEAINLPAQHQECFEFLDDERLAGTMIAIVPDSVWAKGDQPSESSAENDLILFKQSHFEGKDEIAWMVHELAHCLKYKDTTKTYEADSQTCAFTDIKGEYPYPNNIVEAFTFSRQFEFLKQKGISRENAIEIVREDYDEVDVPFFNRLLDKIYQ